MQLRVVLSIVTFLAIALILYLARHEIISAWFLLGQVNLWILALLLPAQAISYYAVGGMIFSYLRSKGELEKTNQFTATRIALELNFVNHILPSGGVSGFSYLNWRLKHLGVKPARATMAQVVRFALTYLAFLVLLSISVLALSIDGTANRFVIYVSSVLATSIVLGTFFVVYIVGSYARLHSFAWALTKWVNALAQSLKLPYKFRLNERRVQRFFEDLHRDYVDLKHERNVLKKPAIWAFIFNIADISMFFIAFAALGVYVNPAMIVIAYGLASVAGFFMLTPGGAGAYEVLMVWILASAGAPGDATIAAIVLARVLLVIGTIASGYAFYQLAIFKYGKRPQTAKAAR